MQEESQNHDRIVLAWNQFLEGKKDAFGTLFELTSDRLYRYGMKFAKDEELVKDCIQDLFIKLHHNQQNYSNINNPLFYLFRALRNLLVDAIQQREKVLYLSPEEIPFHVKFVFDPSNDDFNEEIKEQFSKVIRLLSDRQKEAIYLRYQADMSYEEISKLMGINYQSVRNIIHRSLEKIRSEMNLNVFIALFISYID